MSINEKLREVFVQALSVQPDQVVDTLTFNTIPEWDSVAHMVLISEIEAVFDIMIDTDDVIGMSTFAKACEIVAKHGVAM